MKREIAKCVSRCLTYEQVKTKMRSRRYVTAPKDFIMEIGTCYYDLFIGFPNIEVERCYLGNR